MKLVITGHTNGIGQCIYEEFGGLGLSRSTGFDITKDNISDHITSNTIFINNAFSLKDVNAQSKMLDQSIHAAKIIVIGTNTQYEGIYKTAKDMLKDKCSQYFNQGKDVTYLALGKVNTPLTQKLYPNDNTIDKQYITKCIKFIIQTPYRIETLSMRPD